MSANCCLAAADGKCKESRICSSTTCLLAGDISPHNCQRRCNDCIQRYSRQTKGIHGKKISNIQYVEPRDWPYQSTWLAIQQVLMYRLGSYVVTLVWSPMPNQMGLDQWSSHYPKKTLFSPPIVFYDFKCFKVEKCHGDLDSNCNKQTQLIVCHSKGSMWTQWWKYDAAACHADWNDQVLSNQCSVIRAPETAVWHLIHYILNMPGNHG